MKKNYIKPQIFVLEMNTKTPLLLGCSTCVDNDNNSNNSRLLYHGTFGFNFNPDDFNDKA